MCNTIVPMQEFVHENFTNSPFDSSSIESNLLIQSNLWIHGREVNRPFWRFCLKFVENQCFLTHFFK